MRRRILEWAFWLSITAFLGVISLEAASFLVPRSQSFLAVGSRFYALLRPGWIDLASDLDSAPNRPAPLVVNPRNIIAPPVSRSASVTLPGFTLSFCLFKGGNGAIWSASFSLLIPLVLALFMTAIVFYRLKRVQARAAASARAAAPPPAPRP